MCTANQTTLPINPYASQPLITSKQLLITLIHTNDLAASNNIQTVIDHYPLQMVITYRLSIQNGLFIQTKQS